MYFVIGGDKVKNLGGPKFIYAKFSQMAKWPNSCVNWVCLKEATPFDTKDKAHRIAHLAPNWAKLCEIKIAKINPLNYEE